ncbi:MAG TPA: hypothetical protein VLI69_09330 [Gammaproteobacteria bacterium]|nr:hypothetical protein [Gammaproteobacteria bacterium]
MLKSYGGKRRGSLDTVEEKALDNNENELKSYGSQRRDSFDTVEGKSLENDENEFKSYSSKERGSFDTVEEVLENDVNELRELRLREAITRTYTDAAINYKAYNPKNPEGQECLDQLYRFWSSSLRGPRLNTELARSKRVFKRSNEWVYKVEQLELKESEAEQQRRVEQTIKAHLFGLKCLMDPVISRDQIKDALKRIENEDINVESLLVLLDCYLKLPRKKFFTHQVINENNNRIKISAICKLRTILTSDDSVTMTVAELGRLVNSKGVASSLVKEMVKKFFLIPKLTGFRAAVEQNCIKNKKGLYQINEQLDPNREIHINCIVTSTVEDPYSEKQLFSRFMR